MNDFETIENKESSRLLQTIAFEVLNGGKKWKLREVKFITRI